MTVFAAIVAIYAFAVAIVPAVRPPFLRERFLTVPMPAFSHIFFGGIALAAGALQFNARLRERRRAVHRAIGRIYVLCVFTSGLMALVLASLSQGGMVAHAGFALLAIAWLATTSTAFRMIRNVDVVRHREWMIRSYSLTLAAVTLRLYIPLSLIAGVSFEVAYPVISWACWVPNLIVAELLILRKQPAGAVAAA